MKTALHTSGSWLLLVACLLVVGPGCGGGGASVAGPAAVPPDAIDPFATEDVIVGAVGETEEITLPDGGALTAARGQVLVAMVDGWQASELLDVSDYVLANGGRFIGQIPQLSILQAEFETLAQAESALGDLGGLSGVMYAMPNGITRSAVQGTDIPNEDGNYWIEHIEAEGAWEVTTGVSSVLVGLVDGGLEEDNHFASARRRAVDVRGNPVWSDGDSHGTKVATLACADGRDASCSTGVAWGCNLVMVDTDRDDNPQDNRRSDFARIVAGVQRAVDEGARVINVSQGPLDVLMTQDVPKVMKRFRKAMTPAMSYAAEHDRLVVWSAGNTFGFWNVNGDNEYLPFLWDFWNRAEKEGYWGSHAVIVAATTTDRELWGDSVWGEVVDISAPGEAIYCGRAGGGCSDLNALEEEDSGTSLAAPLVTGTCALVWSLDQSLTAQQVKEIVVSSASAEDWPYVGQGGSGILNAKRALCTVVGCGTVVPAAPTGSIAVDGMVGGSEWTGAWNSTETFYSGVGDGPITCDVHLMHDGQFLYVGLETPLANGGDAKARLRIDGDNSGTLNGSVGYPYTDISTERGAPSAAGLYTNYLALTGESTHSHVGPGSGEAKASSGSSAVTYEFKVPLADLDASAGDNIRLVITASSNGTDMWFWPQVDAPDSAGGLQPQHPSLWAELELE